MIGRNGKNSNEAYRAQGISLGVICSRRQKLTVGPLRNPPGVEADCSTCEAVKAATRDLSRGGAVDLPELIGANAVASEFLGNTVRPIDISRARLRLVLDDVDKREYDDLRCNVVTNHGKVLRP